MGWSPFEELLQRFNLIMYFFIPANIFECDDLSCKLMNGDQFSLRQRFNQF